MLLALASGVSNFSSCPKEAPTQQSFLGDIATKVENYKGSSGKNPNQGN
jgi:hypothetical protein